MLPFVAHQALAHSRTNQKARKPASSKPELPPAARPKRKSIFSRAFEAVAASRLRRAEIELAHYKRTRTEIAGK